MILNVSGRTDVVAFFTPWFMKRFEEGFVDVRNPFFESQVSRIYFKDVDGIKRFVDVYFKGHLAKAFGLKNGYSNLYDEEIDKYRVEKPKPVEGEVTSDDIYGTLFGVEGE